MMELADTHVRTDIIFSICKRSKEKHESTERNKMLKKRIKLLEIKKYNIQNKFIM